MILIPMLRRALRDVVDVVVHAIRNPVFPDPFQIRSQSLPNYPYAEAVADEAAAMRQSSRTIVHALREDRCGVMHVEQGQCLRHTDHPGQCEFTDGTRVQVKPRHVSSGSVVAE
jgi:hypothetical protein